jgi:Ca-activated chloride channel family protein
VTFISPERLLLLVGVAALAVTYLVLQRRRRHYAVRFTNLSLLASVAPRRPGWRRHVPAAVMGLALATLVVGVARPARKVRVAREEATVMLVVDTSNSIKATDVAPTRMEAAAVAARDFADDLPEGISLGLVSFDGIARVVAPPAADKAAVLHGIKSLEPGPGTAGGEALFAALGAIDASRSTEDRQGREAAARVVLLSDGVTTIGRPVQLAALASAERGIPVSTIAFGTDEGTITIEDQMLPVPADPVTMQEVASITGGSFFEAASGEELRAVYDDIGSRVGYVTRRREVGMAFVGVALALLTMASVASLVWTGRLL